jgi:hypothetical protein
MGLSKKKLKLVKTMYKNFMKLSDDIPGRTSYQTGEAAGVGWCLDVLKEVFDKKKLCNGCSEYRGDRRNTCTYCNNFGEPTTIIKCNVYPCDIFDQPRPDWCPLEDSSE